MNKYSLWVCFVLGMVWSLGIGAATRLQQKQQNENSPDEQPVSAALLQKRNAYLQKRIKDVIVAEHYEPKKNDDTLSKHLFWQYIDALDHEKLIFLAEDIQALKRYEHSLDNEIAKGKFDFVHQVGKTYNRRITYLGGLYHKMLDSAFDYTLQDSLVFDESKITFPQSLAELSERWRKKLKFMVLARYYDALQARDRQYKTDSSANRDSIPPPADTTLERQARQRVAKIMQKLFLRYQKRFATQEKIDLYLNVFCQYMDPHTSYLPPVDQRSFQESISKRFFGIGAQLQEVDGRGMKVVRVLVGGAAWKSRKIQAGDVITKVAQGTKGDYVDLVGYDIEEAVKLIRGEENTIVRLEIKKSNAGVIAVELLRKEVKQEEFLARSAVIDENDKKIGYIYLPDFYADFTDVNGAQSSRDIWREVERLKEKNVDGIIIDLRNNGGGSLADVLQIAGYFIFRGPIVQVRNRDGKINGLGSRFGFLLYGGPLVVMVNEFSASASEIFAAAIQDYRRGIVVGSRTFGKGTVQKQIDFQLPLKLRSKVRPIGAMKLTTQKFYRVNGGSTQLRGVVPDIVLPSRYEYAKIREKNSKNHLGWDDIPPAAYRPWVYNSFDFDGLIQQQRKRIDTNPIFAAIKSSAIWLSKQQYKTRSLRLKDYAQEEKEVRRFYNSLDKTLAQSKDTLRFADFQPYEQDTTKVSSFEEREKIKSKIEAYKDWLKYVSKDIYIRETVHIMDNMIRGNLGKTAVSF